MSRASGLWTLPAAAIYAMGVCYYWPTMLGFVAERLPRSGALGLAVIGGAGMVSIGVAMPVVGHIYDAQIANLIPAGATLAALRAAAPNTAAAGTYATVQLAAGSATLRHLAVLPSVLIVAFAILNVQQRGKSNVHLVDLEPLGEEI